MLPKKIVYVYQFFRTPEEGGIIRSYYLSRSLVDAGYEVEVITSHNEKQYACRQIEGLTVHYLPLHYEQRYGTFRRLYVYLAFVLKAIGCALRIRNVYRCYIASVPLSVGFIGLAMKWFKGVPYYFEVGDLWPRTPIEMGYFKNRFLQKFLYGLEHLFYEQAEKVIGLSPAIQSDIEERINRPVAYISNIADCEFYQPRSKDPALENRWNAAGKTVITYFGSIGKVVALDALLDIARLGQNRTDLSFLIVGTGSELPHLKQKAVGLDHVQFLGHVNKGQLRDILSITDVAYLSYLDVPALGTNSPNKLFEALAAGKLCVINIRGWHCDMIESEGCGFYADQKNPQQFYDKLKPYLQQPEFLHQASENARRLAETQFSRQKLGADFVALFNVEQPSLHRNHVLVNS
ncbi:glycosyltransferase family 4 protein [Siphonobacter sp. SORGH_AS_0500]|uniref:glycosyltransferase family 4 protein n=1 Tax=Siphonobacter sp. SORGH_AS_0500 TaxID=1864824 RepID=UPI002863A76B|nr:glycosyltransferase family 4 protein [Siphonobacter sp. SORGH_AS_0500]MDR6196824.1 glycosyltransferase involved in cell wall biosynthesis [Siphonobacter sp. SORGH_AS_0500]